MSEEQNILSANDWPWTKAQTVISGFSLMIAIGLFGFTVGDRIAQHRIQFVESQLDECNGDLIAAKNELSELKIIVEQPQSQLQKESQKDTKSKHVGVSLNDKNKRFLLDINDSENVGGFRYFFTKYDDYSGSCNIEYDGRDENWKAGQSRAIGDCKLYLMKCSVPSEWLYECET